MLINQKQFKKVIVETKSGQFLGKLSDFDLETDTGSVENFYVNTKLSIADLFADTLIINKNQVISFDQEKMIVEDAVVKQEEKQEAIEEIEKVKGAEPAITSEGS